MTDNLNLGAIDLGTDDEFIARHIGPRAADTQAMLQRLGYDSLDALIGNVIPDSIKGSSVLDLPAGMGEAEALASLTWGNFAIHNLIPVTLGNIAGGALFVGMIHWWTHRGALTARQGH